jgi:hypothetical protein
MSIAFTLCKNQLNSFFISVLRHEFYIYAYLMINTYISKFHATLNQLGCLFLWYPSPLVRTFSRLSQVNIEVALKHMNLLSSDTSALVILSYFNTIRHKDFNLRHAT